MIRAVAALLLQAGPDVGAEASREVSRQECKAADENEVVICGQRGRSPFRLPEPPRGFDPAGDMPSVMRERMSWVQEGDSGIQSCGPVGPGGWTGCLVKKWKEEREQTAWGSNVKSKRY